MTTENATNGSSESLLAVRGLKKHFQVGSGLFGRNKLFLKAVDGVDFYLDGRLHLDEMISSRIKLDEINHGFDRLRKAEVARQVIVFD